MLDLCKALIGLCWVIVVPNTNAAAASQSMKEDGYQKLVNSTKDVKGSLSCYACSSLFGDDCWMANGSRDGVTLSIHDRPMLMTSGAIESLFGKPSASFMQRSSVSVEMQSMPITECSPEEGYCMVTRVEYSKAEVKSPQRFFWALERRCASSCLDGCIAIGDGERTRLYLCMSCCTDSLCNVSDGAVRWMKHSFSVMILMVFLVTTGVPLLTTGNVHLF